MSEGEVTEFVFVRNPLVDELPAKGVPLPSTCWRGGRLIRVKWTNDETMAELARSLGANVSLVTARDPRFNGYEISTPAEIAVPAA